jgi:hypothetical protein
VSRTSAVCASEQGNRIQSGHIWFISDGKFDENGNNAENKTFSRRYTSNLAPRLNYRGRASSIPIHQPNGLVNQLGSPLPEIRTQRQNKMSETNCGVEKME